MPDPRLDSIVARIKRRPNYQVEWGPHAMAWVRMLRAERLAEVYDSDSYHAKSAMAFKTVLERIEKRIFPEERIVGWVPAIDDETLAAAREKFDREHSLFARDFKGFLEWDGAKNHLALNYRCALEAGLQPIHAEICTRLERLDPAVPEHIERIGFLSAARDCLEAFKSFCDAYAALAWDEAAQATGSRADELREIARICSKVPWEPAESLHEALQAVHFVYLGSVFDDPSVTSLGRLDRYLEPYLEHDLESGRLDWDTAMSLTRELCAKLNEWSNITQSVMIGGCTADGTPYCSRATRMILEAAYANRLLNPQLGLMCCAGMDEKVVQRCIAMNATGYTMPAYFSEETISRGLSDIGVAPEDACESTHCTCNEMTVPGRGNIRATAGHINLPLAFECVWYRGRNHSGDEVGVDTGPLPALTSWDELAEAVKAQICAMVRANAVAQCRKVWQETHYGMKPFSSCLIDECIARETDKARGGAVYNYAYTHVLGLPNLVDGLLALRGIVYESRTLSLPEMVKVLEADFEGREDLRQRIITQYPKHGTDDADANALALEFYQLCCEEIGRYRTPLGRFVPGFLVSKAHLKAGRACMATPDGRRARSPVADDIASMQGRATEGVTALLNSAAALGLHRSPAAVTVNVHVPPSVVANETDRAKFARLLRTHLTHGGFHVQLTVADAEQLRAAQREPEKHADLMVRVGGYSDYFTHLTPELQETVIARASGWGTGIGDR